MPRPTSSGPGSPRGPRVRYHGSVTTHHGVYTLLGTCGDACGDTDEAGNYWPRSELVDDATGRCLLHVRDESWTPLD